MSTTAARLRIGQYATDDADAVAGVLNEAFLHDPVWESIGPRNESHRRFANRTIFGGIVTSSHRHGGRVRVARAESEIVGASIAFEPGAWPLPASGQLYELQWLALVGPLPSMRGYRNDQVIRASHPKHSLMYLWFLGVHPDRHGRGAGRALLADLHAESDARELPTYLETGTESNVAFYEGDGYEVKDRLDLPTGVPMWLMERPAS